MQAQLGIQELLIITFIHFYSNNILSEHLSGVFEIGFRRAGGGVFKKYTVPFFERTSSEQTGVFSEDIFSDHSSGFPGCTVSHRYSSGSTSHISGQDTRPHGDRHSVSAGSWYHQSRLFFWLTARLCPSFGVRQAMMVSL